ncbi:hypothetical protein BH10ACI3_BH10ACI3_26460 [soil metagenome]
MDQNISLIKALIDTLQTEVETLNDNTFEEIGDSLDLSEKVREYETKLIRSALVRTRGNQRQAAAMLNLKATTLNAKIKQLGIRPFKHDPMDGSAMGPYVDK